MAPLQSKYSPYLHNSLLRRKMAAAVLLLAALVLSTYGTIYTFAKNQQSRTTAFCLDRIEAEWAILLPIEEKPDALDDKLIVSRDLLPNLAREGDILKITFDAAGNILDVVIDWEATRITAEQIRVQLHRLVQSAKEETSVQE